MIFESAKNCGRVYYRGHALDHPVPVTWRSFILAPDNIPVVMKHRELTDKMKAEFAFHYIIISGKYQTIDQAEMLAQFAKQYKTNTFIKRRTANGRWLFLKYTAEMLTRIT